MPVWRGARGSPLQESATAGKGEGEGRLYAMKSAKLKKNTKAGKTRRADKTTPAKTAKRRQRVAERIEKIKFLSFDELRRLMAVIERNRDKALFLIAYRHGLRASEVGRLR